MKCTTKYCRNKTESKGTKYCPACRKRQSRAKDPVKYCYDNLKGSAKRRGKPFTITLDFFRLFCQEMDYISRKGKNKTSYTIDCIINELGYTPENIRVLQLVENSRKSWKALHYDWQTGKAFVYSVQGSKIEINEDAPF